MIDSPRAMRCRRGDVAAVRHDACSSGCPRVRVPDHWCDTSLLHGFPARPGSRERPHSGVSSQTLAVASVLREQRGTVDSSTTPVTADRPGRPAPTECANASSRAGGSQHHDGPCEHACEGTHIIGCRSLHAGGGLRKPRDDQEKSSSSFFLGQTWMSGRERSVFCGKHPALPINRNMPCGVSGERCPLLRLVAGRCS